MPGSMCREETSLNPTDYANLLWAASRLSVELQGSVLWSRVQQAWSRSLRGWRAKELCTTLWALGMLKLNPGHHVLHVLLQRIAPHAEVLPLKHTVSAITGASFLNHMPEEELLCCVENRLARHLMKVRTLLAACHAGASFSVLGCNWMLRSVEVVTAINPLSHHA
jgi:hypothetical protein